LEISQIISAGVQSEMTKRCKHKFEQPQDCPNDRVCCKCGSIWHLEDYLDFSDDKIIWLLPTAIREAVQALKSELLGDKIKKEGR
jgi:hypothetical protein